jgi:uncharacterized protein (TIGR02001 family)
MCIMKKVLFAAGCMVAASMVPVAYADGEAASESASPISLSFTVTSDYRFRGQSQNSRSPAAQASLDYSTDLGVDVGVWVSNVDFSDSGDSTTYMEADFYASYGFSIDDATSGSVKLTYYYYPESPFSYDYLEGQLALSHTLNDITVNAELNYSPDYFLETDTAVAASIGFAYPFMEKFTLSGNVGHQWIDNNALFGTDDWLYWDLGVGVELGRLSVDVRYVSTNLNEADCFGGTNLCEGGVVLSAGFSIP